MINVAAAVTKLTSTFPVVGRLPSRDGLLPAHPPLRTVRESFPSYGSSKSLTALNLKFISREAFLGWSKLTLGFLLVAV